MAVYFIRAGENGHVKIGYAVDPHARLAELQVGNPDVLRLLRVVEGGRLTECWYHGVFAPLRVRSEWFRFDNRMLSLAPAGEDQADFSSYEKAGLASPQKIAGLASEAGLSIEELCRRARIHRTTFSRWREGKHTPGLAVYQRIIDALKSADPAA